jgi:cysteinyl-tRNA synthetase
MTITLYNSKTRRKQPFQPIDPQNVRMYVCGPTVYDRAHLGNARPAIVFDVLYRLLRHTYGEAHVTYVRNFTDVDDKINAKARETGRSIADICDETIGWYLDDMAAVGVMQPNHMPRATQYIGQMVAMIQRLIAGGHAYAAQGHVMFRVRSYQNYGALSGRSVDDMIAGARVEVAPFKEDPMDFVLWKPSDAATPGWDSPWGRGRPGWHIECSAMAYELLGDTFDIHGGGLDLQFPHHENELAQSCCAHPEGGFAQVWMHNEMLQVEGKKMSKSLGNFFTVRDLLDKGVAGEVIRFVMLSTHYRKPMDWTEAKAREAEKTLDYLYSKVGDIEVDERWEPLNKVKIALADDLNTSLALTELISAANLITNRFHPDADGGDQESAAELKRTAALLGLLEQTESQWLASKQKGTDFAPLSNKLYELRRLAQSTKNFAEVDAFKAALTAAGVEVRMSKAGVELIPAAGFDPSKLEGLV